jgi:hypothetical protein
MYAGTLCDVGDDGRFTALNVKKWMLLIKR